MKKHRLKILTLILAAATAAAHAQEATRPADQETVITLEVSPARQPDPALRYSLVPQLVDRTPGNAVPLYLNAISILPEKITFQEKEQEFRDIVHDHVGKPLPDLKNPDLQAVVNQPGAVDLLHHASRRERAGWETTVRQQGVAALLPYLNHIRGAANFLALRARTQLANGEVREALGTAKILFSLASHLREEPLLIQFLVGAGVARLGLDKVVEQAIQHPDSPNLYWALASLPKPLFDMRDAMAGEKLAIRASLPTLRGRSSDDLSAGEWDQIARDFAHLLTSITQNTDNRPPTTQQQLGATALAIVYFPKAKQQLLALGLSAETVNAMPPTQVIGMAMLHTFDHWSDEMSKWASLPYHQAAPLIAKTTQEFLAAKSRNELNPSFWMIPSIDRAYSTLVQVDRQVAILQTVEALRVHAATHNGQFPATLDEITDTPAPLDPTTGKPFVYKLASPGTAELSSPIPPGETRKSLALRYIVKLRK